MRKPRPPNKKKVPVQTSAKETHRDRMNEAVDYNRLTSECTKFLFDIQTESSDRAVRELMAQAIIRLNMDKARSEKHRAILQELEILLTAWSELE